MKNTQARVSASVLLSQVRNLISRSSTELLCLELKTLLNHNY
ncbi:unnamed protein product [Amoebophrya sp. A25]|nr:unnamed protein product [Amoebophrya sp. A25]|eukprot:GSA25T00016799001.1